MTVEMTDAQQSALDNGGDGPITFVNPRTNTAYVLVPVEEFESVRELMDEEKNRRVIHCIALQNAVGRMNEDV